MCVVVLVRQHPVYAVCICTYVKVLKYRRLEKFNTKNQV
jgi:hypothetical protein